MDLPEANSSNNSNNLTITTDEVPPIYEIDDDDTTDDEFRKSQREKYQKRIRDDLHRQTDLLKMNYNEFGHIGSDNRTCNFMDGSISNYISTPRLLDFDTVKHQEWWELNKELILEFDKQFSTEVPTEVNDLAKGDFEPIDPEIFKMMGFSSASAKDLGNQLNNPMILDPLDESLFPDVVENNSLAQEISVDGNSVYFPIDLECAPEIEVTEEIVDTPLEVPTEPGIIPVRRLEVNRSRERFLQCPILSTYELAPPQQPQEGAQFIIRGVLSDVLRCRMLLDSGSFANLIDEEFVRKHYLEQDNFTDHRGYIRVFDLHRPKRMDGAFRGSSYESSQGVEIRVKFGTQTLVISFFIFDKQIKNPPIILGLPFIEKYNHLLDWQRLSVISP